MMYVKMILKSMLPKTFESFSDGKILKFSHITRKKIQNAGQMHITTFQSADAGSHLKIFKTTGKPNLFPNIVAVDGNTNL